MKALNNFDSLFSFVNSKIFCKTHSNQPAKTICMDCKTFCCMVENCGQPHIYHSIENLEYLVNSQVFPFLNVLKDVNENLTQNKNKSLTNVHTFKNNLKTFAVDEKKAIDEEYRKILKSLQIIYNSHMEDINDFIENLNLKFDTLQAKINNVYSSNEININEMNNYVNNIIKNSNSNEIFLSLISKDIKNLNTKLKGINSQMAKFDFEKEIKEIKSEAEKVYPKIEKTEYFRSLREKFEEEANKFILSKKKKEDKESLSKMKKVVSMRPTSVLPKDNIHLDIDLDIFVRYVNEEINKLRNKPADCLKLLDEYVDYINNNEESSMGIYNPNQSQSVNLNESIALNTNINYKLAYIYEYINTMTSNKISLASLEWDNDLSNTAEDYLKLTQGKIEKDMTLYLNHMKEIVVTNYYSSYQNMNSLWYYGLPQINKILMHILLNENYWDGNTKQNALFDINYNVIGICGVSSASSNKITLIINLSYLKK